MCPCQRNNSEFTAALLIAAGIIFGVGVLRKLWPTMTARTRLLTVVAVPSLAGLALAFGLRGNRDNVCLVSTQSVMTSPAPAIDPILASKAETPASSQPATLALAEAQPVKIIAYYFHRTVRCHSCLEIEARAKQAVESQFANELANGTVEWRAVNVEEAGNEHFVKDFDLTAQSLVLVRVSEGRPAEWKNLKLVWDYLGDYAQFREYVQEETSAFLGAAVETSR